MLVSIYISLNNLLNPFPNKPWFLHVCSIGLLETLREKEKLLVASNFSFSHSVFYLFVEFSAIFIQFEIVVCKLCQFGKVQNLSFGKGLKLTRYQAILKLKHPGKRRLLILYRLLTTLYKKPFENIVEKGENAGNQHFLLFQQYFLPLPRQISAFESHLFCRLQILSVWSRSKFCHLVKS